MIEDPIVSSPFDRLLLDIAGQGRAYGSSSDAEHLSFLTQQLGLLRAAYVSMRGAGDAVTAKMESMTQGQRTISFETMTLEFRRPSSTIFLGYNALLNTLCQLDRALPQHVANAKEIPLYGRIRFYRNKVAEHWDAYTSNLASSGFIFKKNKAPIPLVEGTALNTERCALLSQLKQAFGALGAVLKWPDQKSYSGVSMDAEYGEAIFTAFEGIKAGLTTPSGKAPEYDQVIRILLKFGFPAPILDVEEYGLRLDAHLRAALEGSTRPEG